MRSTSIEKNRCYAVSLEVAGPYAMWTDPACGDAPVSYLVPTPSAIRGIFEAILFVPWAEIIPIRVEVCSPIKYSNLTFNYRGPLRKGQQISKDAAYQAKWTVLQDVCYKLYAIPVGRPQYYNQSGKVITSNGAHFYQERFNRLLARGMYRIPPHLGCKEFDVWYCGPLRSNTFSCKEINLEIPTILDQMFHNRFNRSANPSFIQNVQVVEGVVDYAK